jgi:molecular chaperone HscB
MKMTKLCKFNFNNMKDKICQSCKLKELNNKVICGVCTSVRRPLDYIKDKDYFAIFNLDSNYRIDQGALSTQYKDLQRIVHPDKHSTSSDIDIKEAQDCSAYISNAYKTLSNDIERANYLLKLKGYQSIEEGGQSVYDEELLQRLMDIQERIEECDSPEELGEMRAQVIGEINKLKADLEVNFVNNTPDLALGNLKIIKFNLNILENLNSKLYK